MKTLSYAIHAAAAREARRRGADDAVFVSTDGFVLEATTASVLVRRGRRMITPPQEHGILQGTTVTRAAAVLSELGMPLESRALPAAELSDCDALWLLSSGRRAVPVIELDGRPVPVDREVTAALERGWAARRTDAGSDQTKTLQDAVFEESVPLRSNTTSSSSLIEHSRTGRCPSCRP